MAWIRRHWTPQAADEWTKEDYFAMILSVIAYVALAIGVPLAFFGLFGWLILAVGLAALLLMYYIVDPKLRAVSEEYEKRQREYLAELDKIVRWED